ncbi:hypothetical protein AB4Y90_06270 [Chryseobacterium sp. 2TAF14]|uniref:hypothetical protein n=1 Tax=Chryseobacterium sp. 2TAF14 TaxID=3233007 RepID=UPI003F939C94
MDNNYKNEIESKYKKYLSENYNEKYIYKLIIQEGYNQQDVEEVMREIYAEKQKILREKNKYRSITSIVLYITGTLLMCLGLGMIIIGGKLGFALILLAVIIWIKANR